MTDHAPDCRCVFCEMNIPQPNDDLSHLADQLTPIDTRPRWKRILHLKQKPPEPIDLTGDWR